MKLVKNVKFSIEVHSRLVSLIEKLWISRKFTNFSKNSQNRQIFMKIMKLMKNTENIKFSNGMHYRALIFIEKLQFLEKISIFPVKAYPVQ